MFTKEVYEKIKDLSIGETYNIAYTKKDQDHFELDKEENIDGFETIWIKSISVFATKNGYIINQYYNYNTSTNFTTNTSIFIKKEDF